MKKKLEKEIEKYKDRCAALQAKIGELKKELATADDGNTQTHMAVNAIMTAVVLAHGEEVRDDETGELSGWNLEIPIFSVAEMNRKYQVRSLPDREKNVYLVGVIPRE